ncbi:MAG: hypothetical protein P1V35_16885, partial [Planctomycetota bacterium]|nr:hypothetical protein [Planctomycetota bacterium]
GCLGIATKKLFPGMDPAKAPEFPRYTAVHQIGGFLMNPAALRKLRKGQVIDQDPHTKIRTHVEYVGPSNSGNQIVGILEEGSGSSLRWIYDVESGELYGYATIIPYGPGMTSVSQYNRAWR